MFSYLFNFFKRFVWYACPFDSGLAGELEYVQTYAVNHYGEEAHDQIQCMAYDYNHRSQYQ